MRVLPEVNPREAKKKGEGRREAGRQRRRKICKQESVKRYEQGGEGGEGRRVRETKEEKKV